MQDVPPVLEYRHERASRRNWLRWLMACVCGIVGGIIVASIWLICIVGPAIGFLVGAAAGILAGERMQRFWLGLLGTSMCVATTAVLVVHANQAAGFAVTVVDFMRRLGWIAALAGIPGLLGNLMMCAVMESRR